MNVEEIVAAFERRQDDNPGSMPSGAQISLLIASWRERGIALTMIRDNDPESWEASVARNALKVKR